MIILYLVRHGETKENVANILQGHMPGELTERGIEQARQLCKKLQSVRFDALVCSDLKRCVDTAAILNEPHGLTPEYTPLLRERDWGEHTGQNILAGRSSSGQPRPFLPGADWSSNVQADARRSPNGQRRGAHPTPGNAAETETRVRQEDR